MCTCYNTHDISIENPNTLVVKPQLHVPEPTLLVIIEHAEQLDLGLVGRHSTTDDLVWTPIVYHNTWEFVTTKNTPMDTFQTPPTQQKCVLFYWPLIFLSWTFYVLVLLVATLSPLYNLSTPRMHSSVLGVPVSQTINTLLPDLLCSDHCIYSVMQTVPSSQQ
jgi:hypothetical protein